MPRSAFPLRDKGLGPISALARAKLGHNPASENDKNCLERPLTPGEGRVRALRIAVHRRSERIVNNACRMWLRRIVFLFAAAAFLAPTGCGSKAEGHGRRAPAGGAAEPAPPTPDTTPIEPLRTPAGLVLKLEETPAPVTPAPPPSPKEPGK